MSDAPRRKLIEVALPLEAINRASAREKSIRHGHPSTLHLWWARRPLAACRAVLFASLVDDPSARPEEFPTEEAQDAERQRLFELVEKLVTWEATTDESILQLARAEILRSTDGSPPSVLDPFCGGGSIPLEAQRLGLEAHGSDLNPVAVLITKALIEVPPRFADQPPVNPDARDKIQAGGWHGAQGLADDVRYYGAWMQAEAEKRIGHLYPKAALPNGDDATVLAWLWARTVRCPNPACGTQMPLVRSFALSTKKGRASWVEPQLTGRKITFTVSTGDSVPPRWLMGSAASSSAGKRTQATFLCAACNEGIADNHYIDREASGPGLGRIPVAIVTVGDRKRVYLEPGTEAAESEHLATRLLEDIDVDHSLLNEPARGTFAGNAQGLRYGFDQFRDYFTSRQLVALETFSSLVQDARERATNDADASELVDDDRSLSDGGAGSRAYGDAVALYLGMCVSRESNYCSTICVWSSHPKDELAKQVFMRQAIPMTWDFAETNPFSTAGGTWNSQVTWLTRALENLGAGPQGQVEQLDAAAATTELAQPPLIVTDPPYYDNIGYADLSDYFYVWLRRSLRDLYPTLFSTLLTPKQPELIASRYRHDGDGAAAKAHFESGLESTFQHIQEAHDPAYPFSVFYAFKQLESKGDKHTASTGWETMLDGLLGSGFSVAGTWPMRTELTTSLKRSIGALASSIVIVCRAREANSPVATRKEFTAALRAELPTALKRLQQGAIAPVDLAQASIGPGMAVFSRYSKVVEADGKPMRVRTALELINEALDELLAEQEADFDPDTRWCVAWFEQYGMDEGPFGVAETLSRAKNTSIDGLVDAGVLRSAAGKVSLIEREDLAEAWDPSSDTRLTVWEVAQHLIRRLEHGGEQSAGDLLRQVGGLAEPARELAYRLFQICDRKKWASEALGYNALAAAWLEITRLATAEPSAPGPPLQEGLDI